MEENQLLSTDTDEAEPVAPASEKSDADIDLATPHEAANETDIAGNPEAPVKMTKKQQFLQFLKFTAFSASAGVIQFLTISTLFDWTGWLPYYGAFPIGLTLSVIWNFTFNRKFTFKEAHNLKLAMGLVILYNCIIVVPLSVGGEELVKIWGDDWGMVVTVINLLINFVTEFAWDKLVVFNKKANDTILGWFKKKK